MIIRTTHRDRYVILSKKPLEDDRLSFRARGVHAYLMSKPDRWQVRVCELASAGPDGRDSVMAALRELEAAGYLVRSQGHRSTGEFDTASTSVFEEPQTGLPLSVATSENTGNGQVAPQTEKPLPATTCDNAPKSLVAPQTGFPTLVNTEDREDLSVNRADKRFAEAVEIRVAARMAGRQIAERARREYARVTRESVRGDEGDELARLCDQFPTWTAAQIAAKVAETAEHRPEPAPRPATYDSTASTIRALELAGLTDEADELRAQSPRRLGNLVAVGGES